MSRIIKYLLFHNANQYLIIWLGLSIVWRWIVQLNLKRFNNLTHLFVGHKRSSLDHSQSLWNTKSMNNMFSYKLNYLLVFHIFQNKGFSPFSEVVLWQLTQIDDLWWRWMYFSHKILAPSSKVTRLNDGMKFSSRNYL